MKKFLCILVFLLACSPLAKSHATTSVEDVPFVTSKAIVTKILEDTTKSLPGLGVSTPYQKLEAKILSGPEKGKTVSITNDYVAFKVGEKFYVQHIVSTIDAEDYYAASDPYRLPTLLLFALLFLGCVLFFGGKQGIRGLISLLGSLALIIFVLLPGILHGYSPLLMSIGVASLIIVIGSYITHGFNKTTTAAVIGMIATVIITGIMAFIAVHASHLTGFASEESIYLNLNSGGTIDLQGLILGGILIGLLGVLYDAAIGQAISVEELLRAGPHLPKKFIYTRAIRIGREHIGALVNTLAIAYVGASLPLLLLFYSSQGGTLGTTINMEIFATEIIRTIIGSIGLVLAVPITTGIAVWMFRKKFADKNKDTTLIAHELKEIEHTTHTHAH